MTPRFIGVKSEVDPEAYYPAGEAPHVKGQAEVSGISAIAEPEVQLIGLPLVTSSNLVTASPGRSRLLRLRWSQPWEGMPGTT